MTFANKPGRGHRGRPTGRREGPRRRCLPGLSAEQVYLSGESFGGAKSRSFTVRTTEREKDLVQASLDRLLRDETSPTSRCLAGAKVVSTRP